MIRDLTCISLLRSTRPIGNRQLATGTSQIRDTSKLVSSYWRYLALANTLAIYLLQNLNDRSLEVWRIIEANERMHSQ